MSATLLPFRPKAKTVSVSGHVRRSPSKSKEYYSLHELLDAEVRAQRAMDEACRDIMLAFPPDMFANPGRV